MELQINKMGGPIFLTHAPSNLNGAPDKNICMPFMLGGAPEKENGAPIFLEHAPSKLNGTPASLIGVPAMITGMPTCEDAFGTKEVGAPF
jgi:hypothetical protein